MATVWELPAWQLKRWDRIETKKDGLCTVIRAKKARPYGPGHGIEIELETEDGERIITMTVEATRQFRVRRKARV